MSVPFIPETAPFNAEQRAWLNGFFAGLFSRGSAPQHSTLNSQPAVALQPLTILFGSQTGTAETLAKRAAKQAGQQGFAPTVIDMAQIDLARLAAEKNLLLITSTYGEGEPPDNARSLHAALTAAAAGLLSTLTPQLSSLRYSLCALGDTNYTHFCKCGQDFDQFLERLGAVRVAARVDCDLEFEEKFSGWLDAALAALAAVPVGACLPVRLAQGPERVEGQASPAAPEIASKLAPTSDTAAHSRKNPFPALLLTSRVLNAPGSAKQVNHVEFDLSGSGLAYEAGDALGVVPQNCPELVAEVLAALACDGEEAVPAPTGGTTSLRHALTNLYDLGKPGPALLSAFSPATAGRATEAAIPAALHVLDLLLARRDLRLAAIDFVQNLRPLAPRLYSISSSPRAHPGQVHLTVGIVRYDLHGRPRKGVCSTFLADRTAAGDTRIGTFIHANKAFRLPPAGETPVIMVGPGTGIAPFRAFLHERRALGQRGKNWLFFGDQRAATDFLYRDELTALQSDGTLSRLDTAFSRDQTEKIYVQHRMMEQAAELYAWLEAGAHFYVCGDANRMAKDVDAALHAVVGRAGGKSTEAAAAYVQELRSAKRYARDVY